MSIVSLQKLIRTIPKLKGSKGTVTLGAEQLRLMAKEDKALAQALGALKEPTMDVAYKAKANYNVAAFRLKDGKNTVANGALSFQNPGTTDSILKYRINIGENGAVARSNGFLDTGKKLNLDDVEVFGKRKNGVTSTNVASGDAIRIAAEVNEKQAIELAEQIKPGSGYGFVGKLKSNSKPGQMIKKLNSSWENLGKKLSGAPEPKAVKVAEDITSLKFKKAVPETINDFKDIKKYAKVNAGDIKKAEIADLKKNNEFFLKRMDELNKEFAACTDYDMKVKLAKEFQDVEKKYNDTFKYLEQLNDIKI